MHVRAIASAAMLACATSAAAQFYRPADLSLVHRDGQTYPPQSTSCKPTGTTCAESCGSGYVQCGKPDNGAAHCYNPAAGETCCADDSGSR